MDEKRKILSRYFGYTEFRGAQEELIDAVLAGQDVLGIMPTGGGKSLCYQIPALMLPGLTLVISPLISLMQDQVLALKTAGIPAAYLNSTLSLEQQSLVFRNLRQGRYKILYAAPERLLGEGFLAMAREVPISLVAVDEAHCISQWGQDFRPSYLKIPEFLQSLPQRPVVCAYTATATPAVRRDIQKCLGLQNPLVKVTGFDRPNLRFEVRTPESKRGTLLTLLALRKDKSGIVYCSTRKEVDQVCSFLLDRGFAAARYHAGLPDEVRRKNQEDFLYDRKTVMVATNAFGMGIDKSNVSYVIHYNMPQSMESYYQEAGRAGRDGEPAECILLFGKRDIITAKFLIEKSYEESELPDEEREALKQRDMKRLWDMVDYCQTPGCLRQYILGYFGQYNTPKCGNCGNCAPPKKETPPPEPEEPDVLGTKDITKEAQMVLSCIKRIDTALGHSSTITMTVLVLRGSKDKRLRENGLDKLSTYGLMNAYSREELREIIAQLVQRGYLNCGSSEILETTAAAGNVLFRGERVIVTMEKSALARRFPQSGTVTADSGLLAALKALRLKLAEKEKVPAFVIFSNATLEDMAKKQPKNMAEFRTVSGVGAVKGQRYGDLFLKELERHRK